MIPSIGSLRKLKKTLPQPEKYTYITFQDVRFHEVKGTKMTDGMLMELFVAGDGNAFNSLYERYAQMILGYFKRRSRSHADDLSQEVWSKVFQRAHKYEDVDFLSWLFRIAHNVLIDHSRKSKLRRTMSLNVTDSNGDDTELMERYLSVSGRASRDAITREESSIVEESMLKLPQEQRDTVAMYVFCNMSLPEIAKQEGVSTATIKSRLRLARLKIRADVGYTNLINEPCEEQPVRVVV